MPLSTVQKTAVTQFVSITQADKKTAERVLKANQWNVQAAVNSYLNAASSRGPSDSVISGLNQLFDNYRDNANDGPDQVQMEGTSNYLGDLGIALDDIGMLIISELVNCPSIGEMTRQGFVNGWARHGAARIAAQQQIIGKLRSELARAESRSGPDALFTRIYKHTFILGLSGGSRVMPLEYAQEYWRMLFGPQGFQWVGATGTPWLEWWLECVTSKNKPINRDVWNQTLRVAEKVLADETLSWWNEEDSWPSQVDEFVQWAKKEKGIGKTEESMDVDAQ